MTDSDSIFSDLVPDPSATERNKYLDDAGLVPEAETKTVYVGAKPSEVVVDDEKPSRVTVDEHGVPHILNCQADFSSTNGVDGSYTGEHSAGNSTTMTEAEAREFMVSLDPGVYGAKPKTSTALSFSVDEFPRRVPTKNGKRSDISVLDRTSPLNASTMTKDEAEAWLVDLSERNIAGVPEKPAPPAPVIPQPAAQPASDAPGSSEDIAVIVATEPSDYIEPEWGKFLLHQWPNMPSTPAVLMEGARGTGKTQLGKVLASRLKRKMVLVNCQPHMSAETLIGTPRVQGGTDYWQPGPIMIAAACNGVLFLDEFNNLSPAAQLAIKPICDDVVRGIYNAYTNEVIRWADPCVLCACNPDYAGTRAIQEACRDVMETEVAEYLTKDQELRLCVGRTGCDHHVMLNAVKTANAIRAAAKGDGTSGLQIKFDLSPRALLSFGRRIMAGQDKDAAWKGAVINRVSSSMATRATRDTVIQISHSVGNFYVTP